MPGGRIGLIVVVSAVVGIGGVMLATGVFTPADEADVAQVSEGSAATDDAEQLEDELEDTREGAGLYPNPFESLSNAFLGLGLSPTESATQGVVVHSDPAEDWEHPRPTEFSGRDLASDILATAGPGVIAVDDTESCGLSGPDFSCGSHDSFYVACGEEPAPVSSGVYLVAPVRVFEPFPVSDDSASRRLTLVLDDGDTSNDWIANTGSENDFRQHANRWFHADRHAGSNDWVVEQWDVAPGSIQGTGAIGTRVIITGDSFAFLVPQSELLIQADPISGLPGQVLVESFGGELPTASESFVAAAGSPFSGDYTRQRDYPLDPLLAAPIQDTSAFATCP